MLLSILVIGFGAGCGAVLRWALGLWLNSLFPAIPPGTLAANLIGAAIAFFAALPELSPEWRLLVVTGFCGGLTTFSTFSAETVTLLTRGEFTLAAMEVCVHVGGSLIATLAGMGTIAMLRHL